MFSSKVKKTPHWVNWKNSQSAPMTSELQVAEKDNKLTWQLSCKGRRVPELEHEQEKTNWLWRWMVGPVIGLVVCLVSNKIKTKQFLLKIFSHIWLLLRKIRPHDKEGLMWKLWTRNLRRANPQTWQHCRLTICWYIGWVSQILSIRQQYTNNYSCSVMRDLANLQTRPDTSETAISHSWGGTAQSVLI